MFGRLAFFARREFILFMINVKILFRVAFASNWISNRINLPKNTVSDKQKTLRDNGGERKQKRTLFF